MTMKPKVYFTKTITPEKVVVMFKKLEKELPGRVAAKVHSGEEGNQNYLHPEFWKPIVDFVGGTIVETNTAYEGQRNSTDKHQHLIEKHDWNRFFTVDLLDAEGPDMRLEIPNGRVLNQNYLGRNTSKYDSMLVLAHFKGHPAGGYGGALKQLAIGCASSAGKCLIHSAGRTDDQRIVWKHTASSDEFCEAMADAASSVVDYFNGNMAFINVMCNLSVDCDCCASAEDPCMADIGILSSTDPVALDQACLDLIYASDDPGKAHFIERVESRHGLHTIEAAADLGMGSREYELIEVV